MRITTLNVDDAPSCRGAYAVLVACGDHARPWNSPPSFDAALDQWRHPPPDMRVELWLAVEDNTVVGVATLEAPIRDNLDVAFVDVKVDPAHRNRGVGTRLQEHLRTRSRALGRSLLIAEPVVPAGATDHPYRRFVEKHGFVLASTSLVRHLDLPVDDGLLDRLAADARPRWAGDYEVTSHFGSAPEELHESLCALISLLDTEAPTGDVAFEPVVVTPEEYREQCAAAERRGYPRVISVAVERGSGRVVAYSEAALPGEGTLARQRGTLVLPAHRGRRLGTAVKVANLRALQARLVRPAVLTTNNATSNGPMVAINDALGFRAVEENSLFRALLP
ncbi:MAG: GNAT family N-acetyltransferase [Gordonia sp. (in: high G+C Gram-positive bacteria)]|uniref:GNAT family N-acetyltransferase n=1 Tax=Gordonia sp. (in: high G+C Gram-positive bacteria) TaxID=84139 RepID=UPI0039E25614